MSRIEGLAVTEEAQPISTSMEILAEIMDAARFVTHLPSTAWLPLPEASAKEQSPRPLGWVKARYRTQAGPGYVCGQGQRPLYGAADS